MGGVATPAATFLIDDPVPEPRIVAGSAEWDAVPQGGVSAVNARSLARWWARGANGVLRVEVVIDGVEQSALVLLSAGGPVGLDGMEGIRLALQGGTLSFDPIDADEPGDRDSMAEALWESASRMTSDGAFGDTLVLMPNATPALAASPLDAALAAGVIALTEPIGLAELASRLGVDLDRLQMELAITTWLGLTTLKEAHTLLERRQRPAPPPPTITVRKSSFAAATLPPKPAVRPAPTPTVPDVWTDPRATASPPRAEPIPISRLRREAELLRHADGWTALGIPRGAAREMVVAAAARMRERYNVLQRDPNPDARGYALEILRKVAEAERALLSGEGEEETDPEVAEHVSAGGVALERNDFPKADKHYSAARRLAPNDANVLAGLAWARFRNPEHKRPAREEEAVEFIALALQFDAECAAAWRYKGEIARARGDQDGARAALQTAARLARR